MDDRTITLTRDFAASPQAVYDAWINPDLLPQWFGPKGFSCATESIDLREGGSWIFTMTGMGMTFPNRHRFTTLEPGKTIAFLLDDGDDSRPPNEVTVTLAPIANGTRLTQVMVFPRASDREAALGFGADKLGQTTLDKLAAALGV